MIKNRENINECTFIKNVALASEIFRVKKILKKILKKIDIQKKMLYNNKEGKLNNKGEVNNEKFKSSIHNFIKFGFCIGMFKYCIS